MIRHAIFVSLALLLASCSSKRSDTPTPISPVAGDTPSRAFVTYPRFGDSDAWDWDGRGPRAYPVHGIDVSRWQGDINWARARSAGVAFAYIKATEGGDHLDPKFREHWNGAKRAGVKHGAYHYYYFCRPAEQQAEWFIRNVPKEAGSLRHVLDMEWTPHSKTCRLRPDGATVRREARKFLAILEAHYGKRPAIYTTVDFYKDTGIGQLKDTHFWLRSVAGHPRKVYPGASWTLWQYTGTGIVPGISGPVDINAFRGSPQAWASWSQ